MKLKKIASLMLAGVMAVSMFAGCATTTPEQPEQPETPATSNAADMLYSELTGSAKGKVSAVANADLDEALENAVDKYFDYTSIIDDVYGYNYLTEISLSKLGTSVNKAMKASYVPGIKFSGIDNRDDDSDKVAVAVYAINASTSDAYVMEQIADQLDNYLSTLPTSGNFDADGVANCNYTYSVSASVTTRTVNFAGVDTGVKYVAVALTKTVAEKG